MPKENKTYSIERLKKLEEKLGISFKGLYCETEEQEDNLYTLKINGEIETIKGDNLEQDIDIVAILYDENDRVIATDSHPILSDNFLGYDVLSFTFFDKSKKVSRVRLFPKII